MSNDKLREAIKKIAADFEETVAELEQIVDRPGHHDVSVMCGQLAERQQFLEQLRAALADSADAPEPRNSNTNEGENDGTGRIHERGSNGDHGSRGRDVHGALESKTDGLLGAPERHPVVSECGEAGSASGVSTTADAPPKVTAIREDLYRRLINTGRFTGADRGIVMDYFDRAALAVAEKEG